MSESSIKRLEAWTQVGILVVMIVLHAIATEGRISRVEQQIQDLKELIIQQQGR